MKKITLSKNCKYGKKDQKLTVTDRAAEQLMRENCVKEQKAAVETKEEKKEIETKSVKIPK